MTIEKAIDRLRKISEKTPIRTNGDDLVAITMAIQALSQEPCDDAISREAAINIASLHCLTIDETVKAIKNLPSVTQKSGKWHRKYDRIVNDLFWECDKCGCGYQHEYNYCPNCGAKMESGE